MRQRAIAVLLLALGLRLLHLPVRWDEVAWQYAAYTAPTVELLRAGDPRALTTFAGLHPPLFQLLHAASELWLPIPLLWLSAGVAASTAAVWLFRDQPLVALLLACSPIQLAYSAEVNNYPLTALVVAGLWASRERPALLLFCALAPWTHGLAGFVALVVVLLHRRWRALGVLALATLPLAPTIWDLAHGAGTFKQPPLDLWLSLRDFGERLGWTGLLLLPLAALGARRLPRVALGLALSVAAWAALVLLRIAAPHQFPYLVAFGAPFALLVAAAGRARLAVGLALLQALVFGGRDLLRVQALATDAPRAIDTALARSQPGDALYLLAPHLRNDDDKGASSPVLWRLPPWRRMPAVTPYPFAYDDYRHGQPRRVDERVIYVNDEVREELDLAIAAHPRLWLVVYEHREDPRFTRQLEQRFGPAERVGGDLLWSLPP